MVHLKFPCILSNVFSDAQLKDENPNPHPTGCALLLAHQRNTLSPSRTIVEEDTFGDDEASSDSGEDSDDDDEFWDCDQKTKHPSLFIERLAIVAPQDTNLRRTFEEETTSDDGQDYSSAYDESDFSAYTASEGVELPSFQNLGAETTSQVHDLSPDTNCAGTHVLTGGLKSIVLSEDEDAGIASDDDSLFAQYGALLPSDKLPEK